MTKDPVRRGLIRLAPITVMVEFSCESACSYAAARGDLRILKLLHTAGFSMAPEVMEYAARGGYLDCLKFAASKRCICYPEACEESALGGHLPCLMFLYERGCTRTMKTCEYAVTGGDLACVVYIVENMPGIFDERHNDTDNLCQIAAGQGDLKCLQYLHNKGAFWNWCTPNWAKRDDHSECLKYALENGCPCD